MFFVIVVEAGAKVAIESAAMATPSLDAFKIFCDCIFKSLKEISPNSSCGEPKIRVERDRCYLKGNVLSFLRAMNAFFGLN